jgi:hypothetical protein
MAKPDNARISCGVIKIALMAILIFGFWNAAGFAKGREPKNYDQYIKNFSAGTPDEKIKSSLKALDEAGMDAFPSLISALTNIEPAEPNFFQLEEMAILPDGSSKLHSPTIGEACFGILQGQIEGNWPKGFREFYVLTPDNAKAWLEARKGQTLPELRAAASAEALRRSEKQLAEHPDDEFLRNSTVPFLKERVKTP